MAAGAWERIKASALGRWEVEGEIFDVTVGPVDGEDGKPDEGLIAVSAEDGRRVKSGWVIAAGRKLSEPEGPPPLA